MGYEVVFVGWDWSIFVGSVVKEEKPHGWNLPCYSTIQVACGCNGNHTCVALVWWVRRTAKSSQKAFECAESSAFFHKNNSMANIIHRILRHPLLQGFGTGA